MLLLSKKQYSKKARYGYVNGNEPVNYVRDIRQRFEAYIDLSRDIAKNQIASVHREFLIHSRSLPGRARNSLSYYRILPGHSRASLRGTAGVL